MTGSQANLSTLSSVSSEDKSGAEDSSEQLSDLQRDVVNNLELITELVRQVHSLELILSERSRQRINDNSVDYNDDYEEEGGNRNYEEIIRDRRIKLRSKSLS